MYLMYRIWGKYLNRFYPKREWIRTKASKEEAIVSNEPFNMYCYIQMTTDRVTKSMLNKNSWNRKGMIYSEWNKRTMHIEFIKFKELGGFINKGWQNIW